VRKARDEAIADRIGCGREHDWNCPRLASKGDRLRRATAEDRVWSQIDQLFCERSHPIRTTGAPTNLNSEIAAFLPPQLREFISEYRDQGL
jgi:hypothetical protein